MSNLNLFDREHLMKVNHDYIPSSPTPMLATPDGHSRNPFVDLRVAITGGSSGLGLALVRELLIDVLTREQLSALADGLGEVSRRMLVSPPDGPAARSAQAAALAQILSPRAL